MKGLGKIWTLITSNFQMLLLVAVALCVTAVGAYLKGGWDKEAEIAGKQAQETVERVVTQQKIEYVIQRKPKVEVQKELEQKWCRDCQ